MSLGSGALRTWESVSECRPECYEGVSDVEDRVTR
jgi:hypothetical protein